MKKLALMLILLNSSAIFCMEGRIEPRRELRLHPSAKKYIANDSNWPVKLKLLKHSGEEITKELLPEDRLEIDVEDTIANATVKISGGIPEALMNVVSIPTQTIEELEAAEDPHELKIAIPYTPADLLDMVTSTIGYWFGYTPKRVENFPFSFAVTPAAFEPKTALDIPRREDVIRILEAEEKKEEAPITGRSPFEGVPPELVFEILKFTKDDPRAVIFGSRALQSLKRLKEYEKMQETEKLGVGSFKVVRQEAREALDKRLRELVEKSERLPFKKVIALIQLGANPNIKVQDSDPLLHRAVLAKNISAIQALLAAGAKPNATDKDGSTALALAVERRDVDAIKALLEAKADANAHPFEGVPPLLLAAQLNFTAAVPPLLAAKANPNAIDSTGGSALYYFIKAGGDANQTTVEKLLQAGADPTMRTPKDQTLAEFARSRGNAPLIAKLLEAAARAWQEKLLAASQ